MVLPERRPDETRPLCRFAFGELRSAAGGVRDIHGAIAGRGFGAVGPVASPARVVHDAVANRVYGALGRSAGLLGAAADAGLRRRPVGESLTRSGSHPIARLLGDCLVLEPSASGRSRTRRIPFRAEHGLHVGGAHHLALLNHPAVYERIREWLAAQPEAGAGLSGG